MIFSKQWFLRHQRLLLKLANNKLGRWILHINSKEKIIHIEPNAVWWKKGKKYVAEFRTHDKYAKRLFYAFKPLWYLFHLWDFVWYPRFNLGFDSLTAYPAAGGSSPVDGYCLRFGLNVTFASLIGASASEFAYNNSDEAPLTNLQSTTTSDQYSQMVRSFFCFDTSTLTGSAAISSAVMSLYVISHVNNFGGTLLHDVVQSTQADTDDVVVEDFDQVGSTVFATLNNGSASDSAYNDWTLDANGIANISKTGVSKFALRLSWDTTSTPPTWSSAVAQELRGYYADHTGTSNDPKLVVTYTIPGGFFYISQ